MRIGILKGLSAQFLAALAERLKARGPGDLRVESLNLAAIAPGANWDWDLIVDRGSLLVPFFETAMREAAQGGVPIVNHPDLVRRHDRFSALSLCASKGLGVPRSLRLPEKDYQRPVGPEALGNLLYPQPWEAYLEEVGGRGLLIPVRSQVSLPDQPVTSLETLVEAFDRTGQEPVMLQEMIPWDRFVRALVVGGERVMTCRFDPAFNQYLADPAYLEPELEEQVVRLASRVTRLLGLDLNGVDLAINGQEVSLQGPWNPWLDLDRERLTPFYFEKLVEEMAALCLRRAQGESGPPFQVETKGRKGPLKAHMEGPLQRLKSAQRSKQGSTKKKRPARRVALQKSTKGTRKLRAGDSSKSSSKQRVGRGSTSLKKGSKNASSSS